MTAVERVGEAIFSAAFAVIAAFGALVLATLGFFTTLGPSLAIGVVVMLAAALTLVPAIVSVLGAPRSSGRRSQPSATAHPTGAAASPRSAGSSPGGRSP